MNIAIFGLGYVGSVSMACFARDGHHVVGVDINAQKVDNIRQGKSPIIEPDLEMLLSSGVEAGCIEATTEAAYALEQAEIILITVGTPSMKNGGLDTRYVEHVCEEIGLALARREAYSIVAVRSTILPGTAVNLFIPILEAKSGKKVGCDFGFCINPEFLREGSAIRDFDHPPYTIIGQYDERSGDLLSVLYEKVNAPIYRLPLGASEMIKYASNAFHALKVVFANEIGNLCKAYGVDSHQVMDVFVQDTQLNLSPYYLKPGFSFGGSCLGKDVRALLYAARQQDVSLPVLEAIIPSNQRQIDKAVELLSMTGKRRVGMLGLSFKSNTDDLRESPALELAERLIGKGFELTIYDQEVSLSQIYGSNREYIENVLPHIGSLLKSSLSEAVEQAEAVIITKRLSLQESYDLLSFLTPAHVVVDLVRVDGRITTDFGGDYHGICW